MTPWKSTAQEEKLYEKTYHKPTADEIADMAAKGQDISRYFTNKGRIKYPIQRVNVDLTVKMLEELEDVSSELNISRQAVIKSLLRQALDRHYLARGKPAEG